MLPPFYISFTWDRRRFKYLVKQLPADAAFDYYEVQGRNGKMLLKNNQPVLTRNGLKHRKPTWSVVKGDIWNAHFRQLIISTIEMHIEKQS